MPQTDRFTTLDAMRGVAAIGVMLFHGYSAGPFAVPGGYLAVDLFFMLSGFVIALSYEDWLREGMRRREFLTRRVIRLWPMLLLGALLGIVLHGGHAGMLFLLPNPFSPSILYPANPPLWSLLFEVVAYCGFALIGPYLGRMTLAMLVAACGGALAVFTLSGTAALVDFGADWRTILPGLARLGFAFGCGMLIFRLRKAEGMEKWVDRRAWLLPIALIAVMLLVPWRGPQAGPFGLLALFLVFPPVVWLATRWDLPAPRLAERLGDLSYPLYCIHVPILALTPADSEMRAITCGALVIAALVLDGLWDRPARRFLSKALLRQAEVRRASA